MNVGGGFSIVFHVLFAVVVVVVDIVVIIVRGTRGTEQYQTVLYIIQFFFFISLLISRSVADSRLDTLMYECIGF